MTTDHLLPLDDPRGAKLLAIARDTIATALSQAQHPPEMDDWLLQPGACFVTLTQQGKLRGCIGSLQAHRPLFDDIKANAIAAALQDTRFAPLTLAELANTDIEVSLLSTLQTISFNSEAQALAQLRPHIDGIVFECQGLRSTFLPQVWEQLPDAVNFMAHLKCKAGLAADFWAPDVRLQRYTVTKFKEDRTL